MHSIVSYATIEFMSANIPKELYNIREWKIAMMYGFAGTTLKDARDSIMRLWSV